MPALLPAPPILECRECGLSMLHPIILLPRAQNGAWEEEYTLKQPWDCSDLHQMPGKDLPAPDYQEQKAEKQANIYLLIKIWARYYYYYLWI